MKLKVAHCWVDNIDQEIHRSNAGTSLNVVFPNGLCLCSFSCVSSHSLPCIYQCYLCVPALPPLPDWKLLQGRICIHIWVRPHAKCGTDLIWHDHHLLVEWMNDPGWDYKISCCADWPVSNRGSETMFWKMYEGKRDGWEYLTRWRCQSI